MDWKRGPQPPAAGKVSSSEALVGVIEELMNAVSLHLEVVRCYRADEACLRALSLTRLMLRHRMSRVS